MLPFPHLLNKPLSSVSTFGIGGPAQFFAEAHTHESLQEMLTYCYHHKLPFFILGKGSNCLFDDRGFAGLVILNKIDFLKCEEGLFTLGGGYGFARLGSQTARQGWSGLEFASGIPATVGGAVYMNAGANGGHTADKLVDVKFICETGELKTYKKEDLFFAYRTSSFQTLKGAIVEATFLLHRSEEAKKNQKALLDYRLSTQPYGDKSAGCVFRNASQIPAGKLIQECGLKGIQVGGAQVSPMHANFIVNAEGATANDVKQLMQLIKEKIFEKTGILLEEEIRIIPYEQHI